MPLPNVLAFVADNPFFDTTMSLIGYIVAPQNDGIKYYVPCYLPVVSKYSSTAISELFLIFIGRIDAVSQQIYPKLNPDSRIEMSGAIDST